MSRSDDEEFDRLTELVGELAASNALPPGIQEASRADVFVRQLVESVRRVRYLSLVSAREAGGRFADPGDEVFDPLRGLVHHRDAGNRDEAFWMAFLHVYFGKNRRWGWAYPRRVYGALGADQWWTWERVSNTPAAFRAWLAEHQNELREGPGGFGNHRKFEPLSNDNPRGTGAAFESYVEVVRYYGTHDEMVDACVEKADGDATDTFEELVTVIERVVSFGRTGSFDYTNLLAWTNMIPAKAGQCHLAGSTGPMKGARLLLGNGSAATHEETLAILCRQLDVPFDVMEDAICNWQKSPDQFKRFRG